MFSHKQQVNAIYVTLMHKVIRIPKFVHFVMLMQDCNTVTASPDVTEISVATIRIRAKGGVPQSGM